MNKPLIALAMCALTAAVPATADAGATAQYATGPQNYSAPQGSAIAPAYQDRAKFNPTRDTAESMQGYGKLLKHSDCLIGAGQPADGILTTKPNSHSERSKTALLRQRVKSCSTKGLENVHSLVRGSLAEAMYIRQFSQPPVANDAVRAQAFVDGEKAFHAERDKGDQLMASVMSCMVASNPQAAHALLKTAHGTPAEDSAMNAFFAAGQSCGAGATRPSKLSRSFIRAFVADSAWRYARTATQR